MVQIVCGVGSVHHRVTYLNWANNVVYTESQEGVGFVLSKVYIVVNVT